MNVLEYVSHIDQEVIHSGLPLYFKLLTMLSNRLDLLATSAILVLFLIVPCEIVGMIFDLVCLRLLQTGLNDMVSSVEKAYYGFDLGGINDVHNRRRFKIEDTARNEAKDNRDTQGCSEG